MSKLEQATFAAGCFWGIEAKFAALDGVLRSEVGYTGGHTDSASYEQVCSGQTGHAEAVTLSFDPDRISYEGLLDAFWTMHDPTQYHRQGPDIGSQYRSAIFYHNEEQRELAQQSKAQCEKQARFNEPIVTEIAKAGAFHRAEEYHQKYLAKRSAQL
ncbi:MAG: peptide-methionine (S)-S-oxide reductase MsrA [Myxococcales bacterium]|nr:MAG: peptide-methionine (S)-S-oxide reductase MsrA [Myxococcales bacterium]